MTKGPSEGRLLSKIAHDMRSPIGVVRGALSEIGRTSLGPEEQRMLRLADRGLERMLRLTEKLGLAARVLDGELALSPAPTSIWTLLEPAIERARRIDGRSEIAVDVRPPEEDFRVLADEAPTRLALVELVSNALRHADRRVEVSVVGTKDLSSIRIADDGPGPDKARAWLVGDSKNGPESAVGLGLRLAAAVLGAQGGELELRARDGGGTEVLAKIPRMHLTSQALTATP